MWKVTSRARKENKQKDHFVFIDWQAADATIYFFISLYRELSYIAREGQNIYKRDRN